MDSTTALRPTVGMHLPWVTLTLDSTERLAALIPDELLDWRPADPLGHWQFSLAEIVMHLCDIRRMFARQLSGSEREDDYWAVWGVKARPEGERVWRFHPCGSGAELRASLKAARAELNEWLGRDAGELNRPSPKTQVAWEQGLARMQQQGADVSALQLRGPATINRIMFVLAWHESGHRGTLQTLLRINGVDARSEH